MAAFDGGFDNHDFIENAPDRVSTDGDLSGYSESEVRKSLDFGPKMQNTENLPFRERLKAQVSHFWKLLKAETSSDEIIIDKYFESLVSGNERPFFNAEFRDVIAPVCKKYLETLRRSGKDSIAVYKIEADLLALARQLGVTNLSDPSYQVKQRLHDLALDLHDFLDSPTEMLEQRNKILYSQDCGDTVFRPLLDTLWYQKYFKTDGSGWQLTMPRVELNSQMAGFLRRKYPNVSDQMIDEAAIQFENIVETWSPELQAELDHYRETGEHMPDFLKNSHMPMWLKMAVLGGSFFLVGTMVGHAATPHGDFAAAGSAGFDIDNLDHSDADNSVEGGGEWGPRDPILDAAKSLYAPIAVADGTYADLTEAEAAQTALEQRIADITNFQGKYKTYLGKAENKGTAGLLTKNLAKFQDKLEAVEKRIAELEVPAAAVPAEVATLQTTIDSLEKLNLADQVAQVKAKLGYTTALTELARIDAQIKQKQAEKAQLVASAGKKIDDKEKGLIDAKQGEIDKLENTVRPAQQQIVTTYENTETNIQVRNAEIAIYQARQMELTEAAQPVDPAQKAEQQQNVQRLQQVQTVLKFNAPDATLFRVSTDAAAAKSAMNDVRMAIVAIDGLLADPNLPPEMEVPLRAKRDLLIADKLSLQEKWGKLGLLADVKINAAVAVAEVEVETAEKLAEVKGLGAVAKEKVVAKNDERSTDRMGTFTPELDKKTVEGIREENKKVDAATDLAEGVYNWTALNKLGHKLTEQIAAIDPSSEQGIALNLMLNAFASTEMESAQTSWRQAILWTVQGFVVEFEEDKKGNVTVNRVKINKGPNKGGYERYKSGGSTGWSDSNPSAGDGKGYTTTKTTKTENLELGTPEISIDTLAYGLNTRAMQLALNTTSFDVKVGTINPFTGISESQGFVHHAFGYKHYSEMKDWQGKWLTVDKAAAEKQFAQFLLWSIQNPETSNAIVAQLRHGEVFHNYGLVSEHVVTDAQLTQKYTQMLSEIAAGKKTFTDYGFFLKKVYKNSGQVRSLSYGDGHLYSASRPAMDEWALCVLGDLEGDGRDEEIALAYSGCGGNPTGVVAGSQMTIKINEKVENVKTITVSNTIYEQMPAVTQQPVYNYQVGTPAYVGVSARFVMVSNQWGQRKCVRFDDYNRCQTNPRFQYATGHSNTRGKVSNATYDTGHSNTGTNNGGGGGGGGTRGKTQ